MDAVSKALASLILGAACALCCSAAGQTSAPQPADVTAADEVVVFGNLGRLREQVRIAEDAVFLRFNDINSDDRFDIHCGMEAVTGTRIRLRRCVSNDWREQDAGAAASTVGALRGEAAVPATMYLAAQRDGQVDLAREMRRLAATDEQLQQAVLRLGAAMRALDDETGTRTDLTLSRPIGAGDYADLPTDARRMFEVRIGKEPWAHALATRTFTLANVVGNIRGLSFDCPRGRRAHLDYEAGVDWTVPEGWSDCALVVQAKRGTSFMLFELD